MPHQDEIWYAAKATDIVFSPQNTLETFGETAVEYHVLSECLDEIKQVRIRHGRILSERPRVITPHYLVHQALENFGEDAQHYVEGLLNSNEGVRILQYGLRFRKHEYTEEKAAGDIREIADQVVADLREKDNLISAVIIGVDDLWEVSLLRFVSELVNQSAPRNFSQLAAQGLLTASSRNVPNAVRIELESDFRTAAGDREKVHALGRKLRQYGLFEQYQDRFFELLGTVRR